MRRNSNDVSRGSVINSTNDDRMDPERLDLLLQSYGIASEFIEFSGNVAHIPLANRVHILGTMGVQLDSAAQVEELLQARELARLEKCLPPVQVCNPGTAVSQLFLEGPVGTEVVRWRLELEDGSHQEGESDLAELSLLGTHAVGNRHFEQRQLPLPAVPEGYHRLVVQTGCGEYDSLLIAAPTRTWQPECLHEGRKLWGLSTQLYSLRSAGNWGIGDFADLRRLVQLSAANGAHFILLNPLHALDLRYPENASPYSPDDRRFLNPLYIAVQDCEDFLSPDVQEALAGSKQLATLAALRLAPHVDYTGVHAIKLAVLALMYHSFISRHEALQSPRARDFRAFVHRGGVALQVYVAHQAARLADTETQFAQPGFHLYLQWLAFNQLRDCQQFARDAGMPLGLIRDLAVGSSVDGCEVGSNAGLFCTAARIGAPPDNFNPEGQNWGLPPLLPEALQQTRFAHMIDLLRSNMRDCGALRIDHVMALMRLWWCPDDGSNASGAYVHYPVDVLFAILRLESVRNRCVVIGEDLGVVPPEIRSYLDDAAIYSNCVFYFEKYDGWHFRKPEHYKAQALAMIANHDVPPLRAWWDCKDLLLRRSIGLIPDDDRLLQEQQGRAGEKTQLLQWLAEQQLLPESWQDRQVERPLDAILAQALVAACARVESRLLSLQLDDLASVDTPVNIPGTSCEYPNWRRKIPVALEDIFSNTAAQHMLQTLREARTA